MALLHRIALPGVLVLLVAACSAKKPAPSAQVDDDASTGETRDASGMDAEIVNPSREAGLEAGSDDGAGEIPVDGSAAEDSARPPIDAGPCACGAHGKCGGAGCSCDENWGGPKCDQSSPPLSPEVPVHGSVIRGQRAHFHYTGLTSGVRVTVTEDTSVGLAWTYLDDDLAINEDTTQSAHQVTYTFEAPGTQTWDIAVLGQPGIPTATQVVTFTVAIVLIP